jgi:undecaprenyl-diphosphatase
VLAEITILSIVQGITEFLPISSSAHLILVSKFFNYSNSNQVLDISLHLGSLMAILFYYKKDFSNFLKNKFFFIKITLTTIPITICGFFLVKLNYIDFLRSYEIIGWTTILFGLLLFVSDTKKTNKNINKNFGYKNVIIISIFQTLALIPGVSRSGITLTISRFLKFNRADSAKISFFTSIPVLLIASCYNVQKIIVENNFQISYLNFIGVIMSFIFSYFTIKFFLNFLKKFDLRIFVFYRFLLGSIILIYVYN